MGSRSVNVKETGSFKRFKPVLNINVEIKTKRIYAKEKRIRSHPSTGEGSPTMLQAESVVIC